MLDGRTQWRPSSIQAMPSRTVIPRATGEDLPIELVEDPEATGFTLGVMLSTEVQRYIFLSITHRVVRRQNASTPRSCEYGRYAL